MRVSGDAKAMGEGKIVPPKYHQSNRQFWPKTMNFASKLILIQFSDDLGRFEGDLMYIHRYIHTLFYTMQNHLKSPIF